MNFKKHIKLLTIVILLIACNFTKAQTAESIKDGLALITPKKKPNIIYIMLDEWGYYEWSAMGHPILQTPNIDKLASEGIRFTQLLAGGNVCAPTRGSLITGQHTGHSAVRSNGKRTALAQNEPTIASMLKDVGYATGGFGKWGLGNVGTTGVPEKLGFDLFYGYYHQTHAHSYYPEYLVRNSKRIPLEGNLGLKNEGEVFSHQLIYEESIKFIKKHGAESSVDKKPFFAYLAWTPPHGQWNMPEDDPAWLKYKDKQWDSSNQRGKHDAQMYAAMVEMVDRQIGEIVDLLKELKIEKETVVFLCGDNGGQAYFKNKKYPDGFLAPNLNPKTGERFRGGKGDFYEGGLRIPFMVKWPGHIKSGTVTNHLGYFPDIMPTLAELAGTTPRDNTDGISIVPTLLGEKAINKIQKKHDFMYWEDHKSIAVRMGKWKAIKSSNSNMFELYNLKKDIQELNNLAKSYPAILKEIQIYAEKASTTPNEGFILDPSTAFIVKKRIKN